MKGEKEKKEGYWRWNLGGLPEISRQRGGRFFFAPERSTPIRSGTPMGCERGGGRSCGNGRGARLMAAKVKKVERRREGGRDANEKAPFALLGEDGK